MLELERELKQLLIEVLNLEDVSVEQIDSEAPLFGEGLGLDSIDALELGVAVRKRYDVKIDADSETTRVHFGSIANLARFITAAMNNGSGLSGDAVAQMLRS
jgi:acyl carrier protein